jgi:hypothetical protein
MANSPDFDGWKDVISEYDNLQKCLETFTEFFKACSIILFLYTAEYSVEVDPPSRLFYHAKVYCLADKYSIVLLRELAKFEKVCHVINTLELDQRWTGGIIAATKYSYWNTAPDDDFLRDLCTSIVAYGMEGNLDDENGLMSNLLLELPELGRDIARALRRCRPLSTAADFFFKGSVHYQCGKCTSAWFIDSKKGSATWCEAPTCPACEEKMGE